MALVRKGIYRDLVQDEMKFFDFISLNDIESLAAGLEPEEILEYYGITQDELNDSPQDLKYFQLAFNKGRNDAKRKAVQALFSSMSGTKGKESAIAYLKHFGSSQWKKADESDGSDSNFSFTVNLPKDTSF